MSAPAFEPHQGNDEPGRRTHVIVLPSWVGDVVMATPALSMLREQLSSTGSGERVVLAGRAGMDDLLAGVEVVVGVALADGSTPWSAGGMLAPPRNARSLRRTGAGSCLLLPGSLSSAIAARLSGAGVRVGYAGDSRGALLTHPVRIPREKVGGVVRKKWLGGVPIGACDWYWNLAACYLRALSIETREPRPGDEAYFVRAPADARMRLMVTPAERQSADEMLSGAGVGDDEPFVLIVPGANRADKRWPTDRFALVAKEIYRRFGLRSVVSGSPAERDVCDELCRLAGRASVSLMRANASQPASGDSDGAPAHHQRPSSGPMGRLKGVVARSRLMLVGDTGPRHIAAALGVPVVALFGPTDPRWTPIPAPAGEVRIQSADEGGAGGGSGGGLPSHSVTDDDPARYRIDLIQVGRVVEVVAQMLGE